MSAALALCWLVESPTRLAFLLSNTDGTESRGVDHLALVALGSQSQDLKVQPHQKVSIQPGDLDRETITFLKSTLDHMHLKVGEEVWSSADAQRTWALLFGLLDELLSRQIHTDKGSRLPRPDLETWTADINRWSEALRRSYLHKESYIIHGSDMR